jgi:hypothetical protein
VKPSPDPHFRHRFPAEIIGHGFACSAPFALGHQRRVERGEVEGRIGR